MKVAIDAGHGYHTPGRRCLKQLDGAETREWTLNARVAEEVIHHLKRCGVEVVRLDDPTGERDVPLSSRSARANEQGCDYCVSIHHNAGINGGSGGGTVVFTYEGRHSAKADELQRNIYHGLVDEVGKFGNRAEPLAEKNLHMVRETRMPAVLVEVGFMDSSEDVPLITDRAWAASAGKGIAKGICQTAGVQWENENGTQPHPEGYVVRILADSLNVRSGPGTNYAVTTAVRRGEAFTIVGEAYNGPTLWGKLKSGAGWISLAYTEKV